MIQRTERDESVWTYLRRHLRDLALLILQQYYAGGLRQIVQSDVRRLGYSTMILGQAGRELFGPSSLAQLHEAGDTWASYLMRRI